MTRLSRTRYLASMAGLIFMILLTALLAAPLPAGAQVNEKASLLTPTPGSTFPGPSATFTWSGGSGAAEYFLRVGTTPGGVDVYAKSQALGTSATVDGLPGGGISVYVRLQTRFGTTWQFTDYSFIAASAGASKAALVSPAPGVLPAGSATFTWNAGSGAAEYLLRVGTTPGGVDVYAKSAGLGTSATVSTLPSGGVPVYVRLQTRFGTTWQFTDYTFTAASAGASKAALVSPAPGVLPGSSATFTWNAGSGAAEYFLRVGTTPGGVDVYAKSQALGTSATVDGLPGGGVPVYVRLQTRFGTTWQYTDYTFTAASGGALKAALVSPAPGVLPGSSATFTWNAGSGAAEYFLRVGTTPGGVNLYAKSAGLGTSATVNTLPGGGIPVYVRLQTRFGTTWQYTDYSFTSGLIPAALTSPTPGTTFTGTAATFNWSAGIGATEYFLRVGTTLGGTDLYSASQGLSLAGTVSTLPGTGVPVYVRLLTRFGSSEQFTDYTFTATTFSKAELISPTPGSDFAGLAATFTWTAAPNATGYELWVGTTPGDHDVAQQSLAPGGLFAFVNNLPGGSAHLFVRLITKLAGGDQYTDYTFTGAPFCF